MPADTLKELLTKPDKPVPTLFRRAEGPRHHGLCKKYPVNMWERSARTWNKIYAGSLCGECGGGIEMNGEQFGLSEQTMDIIGSVLSKYPGVESAILYGSRAKGNYRRGSDIDMTLYTAQSFTYDDLLDIKGDFDESDMPYTVDVSDYRRLSNQSLKDHIQRVGKVLYKSN